MTVGEEKGNTSALKSVDPEIFKAIEQEKWRQKNKINLIASENFISKAVLEAQGSVLTNKYAEGYPDKRYYGGCEFVDIVESIAIDRAKKIFRAEHANVQPHSGAIANLAVYLASLNVGDTVLGMDLSHGGHLTHGSPVNISGKYYRFYSYGVNPETGFVEMDEVRRIAREVRPQMIIAGASSYPRKIDFAAFKEVAQEVSAYLMVDMAHIAGLIAADLHPSPIPHAEFITSTTHKTLRGPRGGLILCKKEYVKEIDRAVFPGLQGGPLMHVIAAKAVGFTEVLRPEFVEYQHQVVRNAKALAYALQNFGFMLISGGTDNHLLLIDLRSKNITGKEAEELLEQVGITVNKNSIPFDPKGPIITSGLRLGTPAVTSQGFKEEDMETIAYLINQVIELQNNAVQLEHIKKEVSRLCKKNII